MNSAALQAKADKALNVKENYPEVGVMTRKEWIILMHSQGATVKTAFKSKTKYNRIKFNRMNDSEQKEYERKIAELVQCYELHKNIGGFFDITKSEFDFFNTL